MSVRQEGYVIMPDELKELRDEMKKVSESVSKLEGAIGVIQTYIQTEAARCPYRERIDQAFTALGRVSSLENRLVALEVKVAGIAVVSAIVTTLITTLVAGAFK